MRNGIRLASLAFVTLILHSPVTARATDSTQGTSCTGPAAGPISGSTTGSSVVSPAGGNNLVCIGGTWQYPAYQFGSTSASCASGVAGAIQWTGSAFQACNGTSWSNLGLASGGITLGASASVTNPQRSGDATTGFFSPAINTVALSIGGAEAMRVNSSGKVGIGTNNPTSQLMVSNDQNAQTTALISNGYNGSSASAALQLGAYGDSWIISSGSTAENSNALTFSDGTRELMRIGAGGAVGIGTNNPTSQLMVSNDQNAQTTALISNQYNGSSASAALQLGALGVTWIISSGSTAENSNALTFSVGTTEYMRIGAGGAVGIGTTSPQATLDVNG